MAAHTSRHFCASVAAVSWTLSPLGLGSAHRATPSGHPGTHGAPDSSATGCTPSTAPGRSKA
ncbi:hypothetical protein ACFOLD_15065 [Kocuria carniphila]|uniref:hypothetical protein n=1 Tax=Kocuria carniphila TaxID=262208 RepID=UPI003608E8C8